MNVRWSGAYAVSLTIHGAVILLVLFFSYAAGGVIEDKPKVFELVAGYGDNYGATVAPALGAAGGVTLAVPAPKKAAPKPTPAPQPVPIQSAPESPPKPKKSPDLVADLKRAEARREARIEAKYQKAQAAERKREEEEEHKESTAKRIDAEGIREGVVGGSTENKTGGAGGKALTREEEGELDAYFSMLKERIHDAIVPPEDVTDKLAVRIEVFVAADGTVSRARILKSSGNAAADQAVLDACEHIQRMPARPDGKSEAVSINVRITDQEAQ